MSMYRVSELEGSLLDGAVCLALGLKVGAWDADLPDWFGYPASRDDYFGDPFEPSKRWGHAGPIIEARDVRWLHWTDVGTYCAWADDRAHGQHGKTMLQAAMRAVVFAKFGETVELPL